MRFLTPSKNDFLAPFGRPGVPKSRRIEFFGSFLAPPWFLRGPQKWPKINIINKKHAKIMCWYPPGAFLEPNLFPEPYFCWFLMDLSSISVPIL